MEKTNFLEEERKRADYLLYRGIVITFILGIMNTLFILIVERKFNINPSDCFLIFGVMILIIPLIYMKSSNTKKYFAIISIISTEVCIFTIYLYSWINASILLIANIIALALYFDTKILKRMVICKIPLMILANFIRVTLFPTVIIESTYSQAVYISFYYSIEIIIITYLIVKLADKSHKLVNRNIVQNENMQELLDTTINKVISINNEIDISLGFLNSNKDNVDLDTKEITVKFDSL